MPWGRIGVRGTRVWGGVMDGVGGVFVARGRATVDALGVRVTLIEGEGVDIPLQPFGPPDLTVRRWGEARIAREERHGGASHRADLADPGASRSCAPRGRNCDEE